MPWNWEHKDWPNFIYEPEKFAIYEKRFLEKAGTIHGSLKHINGPDQESLTVELMSDEAYKTSEIEGERLNRDSLQSSIRKHFGLKADHRKATPAEQGIAEMMVDLYRHSQRTLTHEHLFEWHKMLTNGRRDLTDMGTYRTHDDPMQILSGRLDDPRIHFEAPPSRVVKQEMKRFIAWFNGKNRPSALLRSGIAHLYFESIHPFEDGNGRIGRAISELALSQELGRPTLIAISHAIEEEKSEYYEALQKNSTRLSIDSWLEYFCKMVLKAQDRTQETIDFLIEKGKFYLRFSSELNARQAKAIERVFKEGVNGFKGGLSAENYISITGAPRATATRDLQNLVEKGAFFRTGERKTTRYFLNIHRLRSNPQRDA